MVIIGFVEKPVVNCVVENVLVNAVGTKTHQDYGEVIDERVATG